jgi:hypothetical protein
LYDLSLVQEINTLEHVVKLDVLKELLGKMKFSTSRVLKVREERKQILPTKKLFENLFLP